jgi:hypothetical protein
LLPGKDAKLKKTHPPLTFSSVGKVPQADKLYVPTEALPRLIENWLIDGGIA